MKGYYNLDEQNFPGKLSNNETYIEQAGLTGFSKIKFKLNINRGLWQADKKLKKTLQLGECYYGPFKGEFGHFLAHTLPFLMFLHRKGVRINYCGMALHAPFLVDEAGNSIVKSFHELRDFFSEVPPSSNSTVPPDDVKAEIAIFKQQANKAKFPFWDISDNFYYWFIHRNWLPKKHSFLYDLSKFYKTGSENSCAIFPRSKGAASSKNNGEPWDYQSLVGALTKCFDKVYVVGHPSQVLNITPMSKVELRITADNSKILEACANSKLIITQHSGTAYLGEVVNTQTLIIYKGGKHPYDIGSMNNTIRFRKGMNEKKPLAFAFSETEIFDYINENKNKW